MRRTPEPLLLDGRALSLGAEGRRWSTVALLATWFAAALWTLLHLDAGWFPADAGTLGHTAERVMRGELPHRDFQDPYTGGLAALYALAFKVLGVGVMSMRWVTYVFFLAWVPAFWSLAIRFGGARLAVLATLLAASWTLPVYAEGMPSWYNLFLATFGGVALLRYQESRHRRWLVAAGVAGGLSVLVKIVGIYFLTAAGLFVLYDEVRPSGPQEEPGPGHAAERPRRAYRALSLGACVVVAGAVSWLVVRGMGARHFIMYGFPPLSAVACVGVSVWRSTRLPAGRLAAAARGLCALTLGAAVPLALWALPYLASGSLDDLLAGTLLRPSGRLDAVRMIGPAGAWWHALPAALLIAWHGFPASRSRRVGRGLLAAGAVALAAVVAASGSDPVYVLAFRTLLWLPPLLCLSAAWRLLTRQNEQRAPLAILALALYGLTSLVQVPFAAPAYFFYAAPLGILVATATVRGEHSRACLSVTLAAVLAFTVLRLNEGFTPDLGFRYRPDPHPERLALQRALGLRVSAEDKADYERVVALLEELGGQGPIFAGPDAPEIYFLTGRANPLPTLYEVLGDDASGEAGLLTTIEEAGVRAVVVRPDPLFSAPLSAELLQELERRFPTGTRVGRFVVAWRSP